MNQHALHAAHFLQRSLDGINSLDAVMQIAADPRARGLIPNVKHGQTVPVGQIPTKRDGDHHYHFVHFFEQASLEPSRTNLLRLWCSQALLSVGDFLNDYKYFDRAPELELVRHLRNAVAHGDKFQINDPDKLTKYPAKLVTPYYSTKTNFEILPSLHGTKLYDFVERGDIIIIIMSASMYLVRVGSGTDPRVI